MCIKPWWPPSSSPCDVICARAAHATIRNWACPTLGLSYPRDQIAVRVLDLRSWSPLRTAPRLHEQSMAGPYVSGAHDVPDRQPAS